MKAVIQRVNSALLSVDGRAVSQIGKGFVVYFCVEKDDEEKSCELFAQKISKLRIFEDENGKMNLSLPDVSGEILFVSQFTLAADLSRGNRPSFFNAELPERAEQMYLRAANSLIALGVPVKLGVFGADMKIMQENAGPVTILWSDK